MPLDQRRAERKRVAVALPVWIDRGDGSPWEGAALEDDSDTGARLKLLASDVVLPHQFQLRLSLRDAKGKPCVLRWQRGASAGVQYLRPRGV
jgi:hypothetical protein